MQPAAHWEAGNEENVGATATELLAAPAAAAAAPALAAADAAAAAAEEMALPHFPQPWEILPWHLRK